MTGLAWWTHDSWEMVRRNLIHIDARRSCCLT